MNYLSIEPFIPSGQDFDKSKQLFQELGFEIEWDGGEQGRIEDDPDLTDKKFPGNPTKSYRSTEPFRVVGEVTVWRGHLAEQVKTMKEHLEKLKSQGINSLNDE